MCDHGALTTARRILIVACGLALLAGCSSTTASELAGTTRPVGDGRRPAGLGALDRPDPI